MHQALGLLKTRNQGPIDLIELNVAHQIRGLQREKKTHVRLFLSILHGTLEASA